MVGTKSDHAPEHHIDDAASALASAQCSSTPRPDARCGGRARDAAIGSLAAPVQRADSLAASTSITRVVASLRGQHAGSENVASISRRMSRRIRDCSQGEAPSHYRPSYRRSPDRDVEHAPASCNGCQRLGAIAGFLVADAVARPGWSRTIGASKRLDSSMIISLQADIGCRSPQPLPREGRLKLGSRRCHDHLQNGWL